MLARARRGMAHPSDPSSADHRVLLSAPLSLVLLVVARRWLRPATLWGRLEVKGLPSVYACHGRDCLIGDGAAERRRTARPRWSSGSTAPRYNVKVFADSELTVAATTGS